MKYKKVKLSNAETKKLIKAAAKAAKNFFAPDSDNGVGAALLTDSGKVFLGCNVESTISGEGTCAERCAIHNAVAHGEYAYKAVAVVAPGWPKPIGPCGNCRQVLYEFSQVNHKDIMIIMATADGKKVDVSSILKYLPGRRYGFEEGGSNLSRYRK